MTLSLKTWLGRRKLQKLITARQQSYEVIDYRKRRAAALKGRSRLALGG